MDQVSLLRSLCAIAASALGSWAAAQAKGAAPVGQFDDNGDIGAVQLPGSASYDAAKQEYLIAASGSDMWEDHDEFHFVWKKVKGDFIVQALVRFLGQGVEPHRKLGIIVRSSLDPRSPHVNACVHGNGLTAFQFRRSEGATSEEKRFYLSGPDVLQLERKGGVYTMSAAKLGETFTSKTIDDVDLGDEVYVGLYVCSHNNGVVEKAVFRNVRLISPAPASLVPYRDYLGSDLEILDTVTGVRQVVYHVDDSLQGPNWTPDGRALIYNRNGRIYRFDLASREPVPIDTGRAVHNNNDHAISFDGKMLGLSNHVDGVSLVYTVPIDGGEPAQITPVGPSYLHGWSPDGKYLIFTGERGGDFNIYRVPSAGGPEVRLTTLRKGLDDGSEYSPDGAWIYYNSTRSGRMQIWRMRPDGSGQEQMTDDGYNNWFPHVSRDGKSVVFITFGPEIPANSHPFYKHVYLRIMPADGGEQPRVVAYLYGGQGTINVNSWSPDNQTIAFVSNSGKL